MARLRKMGRLVGWILATILVLAALLAAVALWQVRRSVPTLDGPVRMTGLAAPVTIARDALGTAVIKGANRLDVARGLGFVHAQERFFEMDLARRSAAGELSELFGSLALERDKKRRMHRMRAMLSERYAGMDAVDHALLQAYADGVNAGLAQLRAKPWQYTMLRAEPRPWQPVDSLLVVGEMFWMLQGSSVDEGFERAQWRQCVGDDLFAWLEPRGGRWDAPLDRSQEASVPIPDAKALDLRKAIPARPQVAPASSVVSQARSEILPDAAGPDRHEPVIGSNNWVVSGDRSISGDAMLANDMHLGLGAPAIWFRAQLEIGDGAIRAAGVTLPGVPAMVVGSNGHVAWGFTNSYGQWFEWIKVPPGAPAAEFTHVSESIAVKGGDAVTLPITLWGRHPIVETQGTQSYALNWVADMGMAYNLKLDLMLTAPDMEAAVGIASQSGIPQQNMLVADSHGDIGWTVAGARVFFGSGGPIIRKPASGLLWTANARVYDQHVKAHDPPISTSMQAAGTQVAATSRLADELALPIGDGGYDLGARAQQIRDRLFATPKFDEKSLGAIQFDDEARFLLPWAGRIAVVTTGSTARPEVTALLKAWNGRADTNQAGYRLVHDVRRRVLDALWAAWSEPLIDAGKCPRRKFDWHARFEYPAEQALDQQPAHLLPPGFASWDAFLLAQVDATVAEMTRNGARPLAAATWGEKNASHIGHPLARAVPALSRWLDMPSLPQAGDGNMPHVAGPTFGQSERLVVAPGHEERATLSMPGGQSGHPMSPYYGAGHDAWAAGRTTPLLAGPAEHMLTLSP